MMSSSRLPEYESKQQTVDASHIINSTWFTVQGGHVFGIVSYLDYGNELKHTVGFALGHDIAHDQIMIKNWGQKVTKEYFEQYFALSERIAELEIKKQQSNET